MAPEKTHSQKRGCSPAGVKGAGFTPQPAPPQRVLALLASEMVFSISLTKFFSRIFSFFFFQTALHPVC